ncbi:MULTISPECIES: FAD-dependent oxidoreductase [unclassified Variovorax]|uniref:FAD-dependent oxidoreductase n=1 Tax=unclassified Variovorax TaxID=663243 RepID=UPI00076C4129|nr:MULTISPECIES: FAD-dependent oxidoreductase [unclassified Variovorax]KWT70673.1 FAD-dependent oxidoreductase [Variovorax sp. WDL1]PNG47112.1 2,4-dichlorophenol 6-monooxygenase [Variovorax sp. B2]PNG48237.1 2,4-dichlorophenol 6-monooxygenase [Variovorax sp. B4]VTV14976.1 2,4-dichlorophenol 6-monooxygenase [Variovorax sp. WDL1]
METSLKTRVLIVGGGPVGLTIAMDLAQRGIDVLVAEVRHRGEPPSVKCNHVSARSMEIFRRLGVAKALREAGLPADYPNDVAYRTAVTGTELSRIPIPARKDRYTATGGPDTWWPTPEPPHRINQIFLEPVLFAHAESTAGVRILNRTQVDEFAQDAEGIDATATNLDTGETLRIRCDFMIGCDGGKSMVRKKIGAKLSGTDVVGRVQSTYFRAPALLGLLKHKPAWATFGLNTRRCGNVYAIDGKETWLMHNYLHAGETFDSVDRDWAIRTILGVGPDFEYEIITKEDWIGRRLVADKFRDRRVFICGDASHLWIPMAGYGMNAGLADAMNLSWTLAAYLQGWAGEAILDAYEAERLPITEQVSQFAMNHALALQAQREGVPQDIEKEGPEGDAVRQAAGRALYELNVQQYCCGGLNFGYFYDKSPLIEYDQESPPAYTMSTFTPSTVPGCRTPHVWLKDGRSLYDALGNGYAIIRKDPSVDVAPLLAAAEKHGVPMKVVDLDAGDGAEVYDRALVLSRPDQHVAWRGDACPADCLALVDRIRGALEQNGRAAVESSAAVIAA